MKVKTIKTPADVNHYAELLKLIKKLSYSRGRWQVFEDFLAMSAISISNQVDWNQQEKQEADYMEIVGRYSKEEVQLFPQMFAHLVWALEYHVKTDGPYDVLGKLFHELDLHNKYNGQFFTPQHICDFMGMISLQENDLDIAKKGYLTVAEPCCGSGAMILGFAKAMTKNNYNYNRQMVVYAKDIDLKCVHMCYLQLSLYGIPAVISHGNTLLFQTWSTWYTPVYMLDGWPMRAAYDNFTNLIAGDKPRKSVQSEEKFYFEFDDAPVVVMPPAAMQMNLFEEVAK